MLDGIARENAAHERRRSSRPTSGSRSIEELAYENLAASRCARGASTATSCAWTWRSRATSIRRWPSTAASARGGSTTSASSSRRTSTDTERDLESLLPLGPNVRVCKGAYLEPPEVAYPEKPDVDAAYVRLLERALRERRLRRHRDARRADDRARDRVRRPRADPARSGSSSRCSTACGPQLQLSLVRRGYAVLVATPYGPDWYRYLMRRLAERPANIGFLLRNLVRG